MAVSSFTWNTVMETARNLGAKKIQLGNMDVVIAQFVAARMYTYHPWQFSLIQQVQTVPLVAGQQDYPAPNDMYRLTQAWVEVDYPGSVNQNYNLNVVNNLTPDLNPTGFYGNGSVMYMSNFGILRLANAAQVINQPGPAYLDFEYQPQAVKVTDMGQYLPFPDEYAQIAVEGCLYWLYKFGDDERAGTMVKQGNNIEYTGQQAIFEGQLMQMAGTDRAGDVDTIFPSETLGWGPLQGERNPLGPWW
jgi:hypothetical protein